MRYQNMVYIAVFSLLVFSGCTQSNLAGQPTVNGIFFADPVFRVAPSSLMFPYVQATDSYTPQTIAVEIDDVIIYKYGYYVLPGQDWTRFELSGGSSVGDWLLTSGSASVSIMPPVDASEDTTVYVIVFSCKRDGTAWDCYGESDALGAWQLGTIPATFEEKPTCPDGQCELDGQCFADGDASPNQDALCFGGTWLNLPGTPGTPGQV